MAEEVVEKQEKKKGGLGKILIIVILLLIILAGAGVAAYLFILSPKETVTTQTDNTPMTPQVSRNTAAEPGPIQAYPPFLVNLSDPGGTRYLKVTLSLELSNKDKKFADEVAIKEVKIKDIIISILSSKSYDEISTTQGKIALKQEILRRLNTILTNGKIAEVYITEFVVQ